MRMIHRLLVGIVHKSQHPRAVVACWLVLKIFEELWVCVGKIRVVVHKRHGERVFSINVKATVCHGVIVFQRVGHHFVMCSTCRCRVCFGIFSNALSARACLAAAILIQRERKHKHLLGIAGHVAQVHQVDAASVFQHHQEVLHKRVKELATAEGASLVARPRGANLVQRHMHVAHVVKETHAVFKRRGHGDAVAVEGNAKAGAAAGFHAAHRQRRGRVHEVERASVARHRHYLAVGREARVVERHVGFAGDFAIGAHAGAANVHRVQVCVVVAHVRRVAAARVAVDGHCVVDHLAQLIGERLGHFGREHGKQALLRAARAAVAKETGHGHGKRARAQREHAARHNHAALGVVETAREKREPRVVRQPRLARAPRERRELPHRIVARVVQGAEVRINLHQVAKLPVVDRQSHVGEVQGCWLQILVRMVVVLETLAIGLGQRPPPGREQQLPSWLGLAHGHGSDRSGRIGEDRGRSGNLPGAAGKESGKVCAYKKKKERFAL